MKQNPCFKGRSTGARTPQSGECGARAFFLGGWHVKWMDGAQRRKHTRYKIFSQFSTLFLPCRSHNTIADAVSQGTHY